MLQTGRSILDVQGGRAQRGAPERNPAVVRTDIDHRRLNFVSGGKIDGLRHARGAVVGWCYFYGGISAAGIDHELIGMLVSRITGTSPGARRKTGGIDAYILDINRISAFHGAIIHRRTDRRRIGNIGLK